MSDRALPRRSLLLMDFNSVQIKKDLWPECPAVISGTHRTNNGTNGFAQSASATRIKTNAFCNPIYKMPKPKSSAHIKI